MKYSDARYIFINRYSYFCKIIPSIFLYYIINQSNSTLLLERLHNANSDTLHIAKKIVRYLEQ